VSDAKDVFTVKSYYYEVNTFYFIKLIYILRRLDLSERTCPDDLLILGGYHIFYFEYFL